MKINETFVSIQGEGKWAGKPAIFIRTAGCCLSCPFCDTKYAWKMDGIELVTEDDIYLYIITNVLPMSKNIRTVIITGGEPLMIGNYQKFMTLTRMLKSFGFKIQVETTGLEEESSIHMTNLRSILSNFSKYVDLFVVSPKFDYHSYNVKEEYSTLQGLIFNYYTCSTLDITSEINYKFLYQQNHISKILDIISNGYVSRDSIYIMAQTPSKSDFNIERWQEECQQAVGFCLEHNLKYSPRLHIDIYGVDKRGV